MFTFLLCLLAALAIRYHNRALNAGNEKCGNQQRTNLEAYKCKAFQLRVLGWHVCRTKLAQRTFFDLRILLRKMLRKFPDFLGLDLFSGTSSWEPKCGILKSAGKRQESATFLQRSFSDVAVQFFACCSAAFGKMTSALQKTNVAVQFLQRNFPKIASQLPFFACGMLQGWC